MRNVILGIFLGFIITLPITTYAKTVFNPVETVGNIGFGTVTTTKITTEEGTYRIFTYSSLYGGGITAVKIK